MEEEKKNVFYGITDVGQAESLLNQFRCDRPKDLNGAEEMLDDLLDALLLPDIELTGDANAFHNFAVSITRISNDNKDAFNIVREGLKIHSGNVDLLADAIKYGYNCGQKEYCQKCFATLNTIKKDKWTWRAFSFSIDYLREEWADKDTDTAEDILKLVKEYQEMRPDEEDAWLCEYEVYDSINQTSRGIEVLEKAIEQFRFCPKCCLRYAEIMMDRGDYEKAEPIIKKLRLNPKTGESINLSFMFYLDGLCKMSKLMASDEYEDGDVDEREVIKVYRSFRLALTSPGLREGTKQRIDENIERLSKETGIEYPEYW